MLGLQYIHASNVIHRDIKGANVLVTPSGRCKLADFGVSMHLEAMGTVSLRGTPYFLAPELLRSTAKDGPTLRACDVWSLGCTVFQVGTSAAKRVCQPGPLPGTQRGT